MSKKIGGVVVLVGICALSVFLLNCGTSPNRPEGVLYVLTEGINGIGNNVSSFGIDLDTGSLSLVNSNASTCANSSCGLPIGILLDPLGATAFVLGQNAISAYTVNSDGSLSSPSNPTPLANTTCSTPPACSFAIAMTRDAAGQFLFVLEMGSNTNCPFPVGSSNSMYAGCPSVETFAIKPGSTDLTEVPGSPFYIGRIPSALSVVTFAGPGPSSGTTPACGFTTTEEFLFVTSTQDLSQDHNDNALSLFCVNLSSGSLTDLTPNPPYTPPVDPISVQAVNTNPAGENTTGGVFVYVGSQPSSTGALSIFQMCTVVGIANCTQENVTAALLMPVLTPAPPTTGQNPIAMAVDPTNTFLYVLCYGSSQVYGYRIAGSLTPLTPTNGPTGSEPVALALHPSINNTGQFLFTSNNAADNITGFTLNTLTGSMGSPTTTISPAAPSGMAVH